SGNTEGPGVVGAKVGLLSGVAVMGHAHPGFGDQSWREGVIEVDAGRVRGGDTGGLKATASRTAEEGAKARRLEGIYVLVAEAIAEVALLRHRIVGLDVIAG